MFEGRIRKIAFAVASLLLMSIPAIAQNQPVFSPGNLVVVVEGCGVHGGTCTGVSNGTGPAGGYGDNQAAPLTLFQYTPNATASATFVGSFVLPQTSSGANVQVSGELGSGSEGTIQLSNVGQYLTLMGYGIDALSFNANPTNYGTLLNPKGAPNYGALGQTGSLTLSNQTLASPYPNGYTPVPRVLALIDANGNVNTSTAFYNIFDFNNPRSAYTLNGSTVYVSGQGSGTDGTGGVFYSPVGGVNNTPTAITGLDSCLLSGCTTPTIAQDTRTVQIYNGTLYISVDSTEGKSNNRSFIGTLGNPPATTMYVPTTPPTGDLNGPTELTGFGNTGGTGKISITSGPTSQGNNLNAGLPINLSPVNYFFASSTVLYVADSGAPKNNSNGNNNCNSMANIGDGGLQKWVNTAGTWALKYTLYQGLNLVNNCNTTGTSGLFGVTGVISGSSVYLYVTNSTLSDLDTTYLYGITDTLTNTTPPGTSLAFTLLDTAPTDSNFKGISWAPTIPAGDVEITTVPSGLAVTTSGTGCSPATFTTPLTQAWTPMSSCELSVTTPQSGGTGVQYAFSEWEDSTTGTNHFVTAPTSTATYTATFNTQYQLTTAASPSGGGSVTPASGSFYNSGTVVNLQAVANTNYAFTGWSGNVANSTAASTTVTMSGPESVTANFMVYACPCTAFSGGAVPTVKDKGPDQAVELGVKFIPSVSGTVSGIRFYKSANNTGTHIGNLWDSSGNNLASATFTSETASGWQQVTFTTPVAVAANSTYVVSYFAPNGHFSADQNFFVTAVNNPPLQFPAGPGNGVYKYGAASTFPTNSYNSTNYWVDVVFTPGAAPASPSCTTATPCMIWNNATMPTLADSGPGGAVELGVKFTSSVGGMITGIRFYKSANNVGTHTGTLWDGLGNQLATGTFTGETASGWQQMTFNSPVNISANTVYVASYYAPDGHFSADQNFFTTAVNSPPLQFLAGPGNGVYVYGPGGIFPGNSYNSTNYWVDVLFAAGTAAMPPTCSTSPCTIWSSATTPTATDNGPDSSVELGVRFTSSEAGWITGIRFYKSAKNTGPHTGTLWSGAGAQLATGTFTGETASGWEQMNFSNPVAIEANTTYVASYLAPNGHYSADQNFFAAAGVNNPPLQALAGNNGVYVYGPGGIFPSNSYNSTNYWVDVVFQVPSLVSVTPSSGQQGQTIASVALVGNLTHWVQGTTTATFGSPGIAVNSLTVTDATHATASISISPAAATGSSNVTVTTGGEVVTLSNGFTVGAASCSVNAGTGGVPLCQL